MAIIKKYKAKYGEDHDQKNAGFYATEQQQQKRHRFSEKCLRLHFQKMA